MIAVIAFDADDTLWHNERFFQLTKERFVEWLADYAAPEDLGARLYEAEKRNLDRYGFGVKGFTLSMIETAIEVSNANLPASVIRKILDEGREMLAHPVELLPGAGEAVDALARTHKLVIVTKGDLFHQERKIAASGLADYFAGLEIVSDKTPDTYRDVFARYGPAPEACAMVGNSLRSDISPAIEAGGWGVYVPHDLSWAYEHAEAPSAHPRFREIPELSQLPNLISELEPPAS